MISFLSGTQEQGADYAPQSGEVIGILSQLGDSMNESLKEVIDTEAQAVQSHEELVKAKRKEIELYTETVERKMGKSAELGVAIVTKKNDLEDMQEGLVDDQKLAADMNATCANKTAEWEEAKKTRKEEVKAIAETIELLNDDDALELFKSTLPSAAPSFVQLANPDATK